MSPERVVVVGGGVLGTFHAWEAVRRGFEVVHVEREAGARGATVRNFGLIWVSGRAPGAELTLALRARDAWEVAAEHVPDAGFRPAGSLTVATEEDGPEARAALELAASLPDAADRGFALLEGADARRRCPA
ncbi:FAD-dependent oxidoreductase, partial [Acidimicrobiaceae bacterium USS-CC1]|nr:FAD-dependent oxidoreductase [Acidiferrimicrobium australe]